MTAKALPPGVIVHQMTEDDVKDLTDLNDRNDWNIPYHDLLAQYRTSPKGSFAAELNGENIGFCMTVHWSESLAFGGMSLVREDLRGQGIGSALWKRRFAFAGDRNMGVTAVANRLEPNKRLGYTVIGKWRLVAYCGKMGSSKIRAKELSEGLNIVPYDDTLLQDIVDYDTALNSVGPRERFIRLCIEKPNTTCYVARENGRVIGYGIIQPAIHGYRLAPLYCDYANVAIALLKRLLQSLPEEMPVVTFYAPDCNATMVELAKECDLELPFGTPFYRQFTKYDLAEINVGKVFATFGCETCFI